MAAGDDSKHSEMSLALKSSDVTAVPTVVGGKVSVSPFGGTASLHASRIAPRSLSQLAHNSFCGVPSCLL